MRRALSSLDARAAKVLVPTYGPPTGVRTVPDLVFTHGKGVFLYDDKGREYVDMSGGIAVSVLGHADALVAQAVNAQLNKVTHVSNLFHSEPALLLAERLLALAPGFSQVFFCNSGTEANEGALKFARIASNAKAQDRSRVVAFKSSFHGRSLGALSVTYKPAIRLPFAPLLNQNVDFCDFNDLKAVEERMADDVMAVIVEPVQGEGGVNPAQKDFLQGLRALCNRHGSVLIFDEIQVGLGRSGDMWGHEVYGVKPDLMTLAKPLAGGLPIGAVMLAKTYVDKVPPTAFAGAHGTTFGGNPVVCAAALSVLDRLSSPSFMASARASGAELIAGLDRVAAKHAGKVVKVRRPLGDRGLFAGVQLSQPVASQVTKAALERGVVFITAGDKGDTIRICPPLIATKEHIKHALAVLDEALGAVAFASPVASGSPTTATTTTTTTTTAKEKPRALVQYDSLEAYRRAVDVPLPPGFSVGADKLSFVPKELGGTKQFPMRLSLIALEGGKATKTYAAVFTKNAFPGAPIKVGKAMVASGAAVAGVLINNKISNVQPRGGGTRDSETLCRKAAELLGLPAGSSILPASTGVIGWSLPVPEMLDCLPRVIGNLSAKSSALVAAEAIMTTDRYPKARTVEVKLKSGGAVRITGVAKGAGMIEPNMATMLVYLMTDALLPRAELQAALEAAVNAPGSFNRITVDSDQSTSDMCLLLSSEKRAVEDAHDKAAFASALQELCASLAEDIVRNGEGTRHVVRVTVNGAPTAALAHGCGKAIVNSPLVKTAVYGNDPNVGRILAALGSYLGRQQSDFVAKKIASRTTVVVGGVVVYANGEFALDAAKEQTLNAMMKEAELDFSRGDFPRHNRVVAIDVELNAGEFSTVVIGSDLSQDYVDVNADYRS